MAHREGIREYLKDVRPKGLVYDWGCGTKPMKNYLPIDGGFLGIDKLKHVGADLVVDIEKPVKITTPTEMSTYAFCIEVIEHVWNSKQLLDNIYNHLKDGGKFYFSQPYHYITHKEDDRIRYTHHGLRQLLEESGFKDIEIVPTVGELENAEGFVGSAVK